MGAVEHMIEAEVELVSVNVRAISAVALFANRTPHPPMARGIQPVACREVVRRRQGCNGSLKHAGRIKSRSKWVISKYAEGLQGAPGAIWSHGVARQIDRWIIRKDVAVLHPWKETEDSLPRRPCQHGTRDDGLFDRPQTFIKEE